MTISRSGAAELLHNTADLIDGIKAKDYGEPENSFQTIAKYWSLHLGVEITVHDVGMLMILLKVAREGRGERFHKDNLVDICGYAALVGSDDGTRPEKASNSGQGVAGDPDADTERGFASGASVIKGLRR